MHEILKERLQLVIRHASIIEKRVSKIEDAAFLQASEQGEIQLASLITRLQALSENVKKIQKLDSLFQTFNFTGCQAYCSFPRFCLSTLRTIR